MTIQARDRTVRLFLLRDFYLYTMVAIVTATLAVVIVGDRTRSSELRKSFQTFTHTLVTSLSDTETRLSVVEGIARDQSVELTLLQSQLLQQRQLIQIMLERLPEDEQQRVLEILDKELQP